MISVLILTKNEQQDLPGCLRSVDWSDDVWVLDSLSTDDTQAIARAAGARVIERAFDNWSAHQNWALQNIPFRHPWVFYLDADERVTPELAASLRGVTGARQDASDAAPTAASSFPVAYEIHRRDLLGSTWLQHVQLSSFYVRLFRPESIRYERLVNPVTRVDGETGRLQGYLDHYPFSKGIGWWIARHNDYSGKEAREIIAGRANEPPLSLRTALFAQDFQTRRRMQKAIFYRLPGRPLLKFLAIYFGKRGFLDGRAGLQVAILQSIYEYLIVAKTRELEAGGPQTIP
ncbi:glycosyltransferase family 2 protein [Terriglobus sp.]|uniref:glycosyltransferase family 2 protein n=1 Tax=Terriglobus sp. TaxID=1889013 RepID=UPI003B009414